MLYDLQPHETVTGGAWYSDQEFETEFVDVLNAQCLQFLQNKVYLLKLHFVFLCYQKAKENVLVFFNVWPASCIRTDKMFFPL